MCEIRPNGTNTIMAYAIDLKDRVEFKVDDPEGPRTSWARYIYGIVQEMKKLGVDVKGFNTAFAGDVPLGAGMSSSAALESCFAFALNDLFGDNKVSKWDMVLAGQATEHNYCGVNCGIMDQFASVFGKQGCLMRLDCRSREFEYFPFQPEGYKLVLLDSVVKHELAGSPYNDRRRSCENVVKHIADKHPESKFETLRDCTWEQLEEVKGELSAEDYMRAKFVLGEKDRVLAVCDALQKGDYETVGQKMYETHEGLSKDYEVSCEELDYLNLLAKENGVTGSTSENVGGKIMKYNYETIDDNGSKYSFEIKDNKTVVYVNDKLWGEPQGSRFISILIRDLFNLKEKLSMKDINYDEVLDKWYDKVIEKADKYNEKVDECKLGSVDYYKFKNYSNGLYMALSMLSLEERKAKRKLK